MSRELVTLLKPGPVERDLSLTRDLLDRAVLMAPERATANADIIRWQLVREGDVDAFDLEVHRFPENWPPAGDGEWGLENRVARDRVAALAGRGPSLMYAAWSD